MNFNARYHDWATNTWFPAVSWFLETYPKPTGLVSDAENSNILKISNQIEREYLSNYDDLAEWGTMDKNNKVVLDKILDYLDKLDQRRREYNDASRGRGGRKSRRGTKKTLRRRRRSSRR